MSDMRESQNGRETFPRLRPVCDCGNEEKITRLEIAMSERVTVDRNLEARLLSIEQKIGSLTWRLAIVVGAVQAAAQFIEYFKR